MSTAAAPVAVHVAEMEGRGRALVASRPIKPGEVILTDSPLVLYATATASASANLFFCCCCFRSIPSMKRLDPVFVRCPTCSSSLFCGPECLAQAQASSHSPWACHTLSRLRLLLLDLDPDLLTQAYFLIAAYTLSPSHFSTLLSLQGAAAPTHNDDDSHKLHSLLSSSPHPGFSPDLTAALLAKDRMNAFGLMEPFHPNDAAHRRVRAYAIYPNASFFNHDCLPNACRFDYVDSAPHPNNTDIIVRAIHDIPQGREVCLSYFPVNWTYAERQERLLEDYGFLCDCDRCKVEKNWKDDDEAEGMEEEDDNGMGDDDHIPPQEGGEDNIDDHDDDDDDDFPHAYFFVRYQCERDNCGGTLAPLPPSPPLDTATVSHVMECNVCGQLTKADELGPAHPQNVDSVMLDE